MMATKAKGQIFYTGTIQQPAAVMGIGGAVLFFIVMAVSATPLAFLISGTVPSYGGMSASFFYWAAIFITIVGMAMIYFCGRFLAHYFYKRHKDYMHAASSLRCFGQHTLFLCSFL